MEKPDAKLLDHIIDIKHSLGGLEAKLDSLDSKMERHLDDELASRKAIEDRLIELETKTAENSVLLDGQQTLGVQHDKRLNKVETRQSWMLGIGATITFLISCVIGFLGFKHHD